MRLYELVNVLQNFCHEGHAMREVIVSTKDNDTILSKFGVYEDGNAVVIEIPSDHEDD